MSKDRLNGTLCEADSKDEEAGEEVWISGCEWLCGCVAVSISCEHCDKRERDR